MKSNKLLKFLVHSAVIGAEAVIGVHAWNKCRKVFNREIPFGVRRVKTSEKTNTESPENQSEK